MTTEGRTARVIEPSLRAWMSQRGERPLVATIERRCASAGCARGGTAAESAVPRRRQKRVETESEKFAPTS